MKNAIVHGLVLGVAICVWTLVEYALGFHNSRVELGIYSSYAVALLPLTAVILAARAEWRRTDGHATWGALLLVGVVVMLTSYVVATPFQWVYHRFINPGWLDALVAFERAKLVADGASPADVDLRVAKLVAGNSTRAQLTGGLVGSLIMGLVLGAPTALVFRLRRAGHAGHTVGAS